MAGEKPRCFGVSNVKPEPEQCDSCRCYIQCAKELRAEIRRLTKEDERLMKATNGLARSLGGSITWNTKQEGDSDG